MSLDPGMALLKTLKESLDPDITLIFHDSNGLPVLSISYKGFFYEVKNMRTYAVETCVDLDSVIKIVEEAITS